MRPALLALALVGCDDGSGGPLAEHGEACGSSAECNWALLCIDGRCVDGPDSGRSPPPQAIPDVGPEPDARPGRDGFVPPPPPPPPRDAAPPTPDAAPPTPDAAPDGPPPPPGVRCDEASGRAVAPGPFACAAGPEAVTVDGRFQVFRYEASHPLADRARAFPCAQPRGEGLEAPDAPTEACSVAGVRPWHTVRWADANRACAAVGWRLCTADELARACAGPERFAYTWGPEWSPGTCNLRESFNEGGMAGPAPTGALAGCVSAEGAFDLTGNLWEWVAGGGDGERTVQGAGWRTVAERHRPADLVCTTRTRITGADTPRYANPDVGFRCCRGL